MPLKSLKGWSEKNPVRRKAKAAILYLVNKKGSTLWRDRHPRKQKELLRRLHLMRAHGLTVEQYDAMLAAQNGRCAICNNKRTWRALAVDHCHRTGNVRALLCSTCNNHLGVYEKHRDKFETYLARFDVPVVVDHGEGDSWAAAAHGEKK